MRMFWRTQYTSVTLLTLFILEAFAQSSTPLPSSSTINGTITTSNITGANDLSNGTSTISPSVSLSTSSTTERIGPQPRKKSDDETSLGYLCAGEREQDRIGTNLGCSCKRLDGGLKMADCSERDIVPEIWPSRVNISLIVRVLDLSKNSLDRLDENTFGNCDGLLDLKLYRNQITYVRGFNCTRVRRLDLSWNKMHNLTNEAFQNLSQLVELDLSYNNLELIEPFTLDRLKNLEILNLASNPIGNDLQKFSDHILSLDNLERLETLDLTNTSLPDFPLSLINGTKNIRRLRLGNNLITALPEGVLHQLTELEYLELSGNYFVTLVPYGFNGLKSLRHLVMDRMPYLTSIDRHAFAGLESLNEVSLQKNRNLSYIDVMAFRMGEELKREMSSGDSHPKVLRLGDSNLHYFEFGLLVWKDTESLELYRNPWICDCNLQWVSAYYNASPSEASVLADNDFKCKEPHIFAGEPVVKVQAEEMLCYSQAATVAVTVTIIVFSFLLFTFCSVIILNYMGMLPDWVRRYNIFGSGTSLPTYMRVNPKPSRARRMERLGLGKEPVPGDLEWDSADIGHT